MNRNFIFVFILLAALSLVNARPHELRKRTITFGQCPNFDGPVFDVTISPDPVVAGASVIFTVSGTLKNDIVETTQLTISFVKPNGSPLETTYSRPICSDSGDVKCPIKAGTKFTTTATVTPPGTLPNPYGIAVVIFEPPRNVLGCAFAGVGS